MGSKPTGPANDFSRAVNAEIRALMARRHMTQTALAEAVGIGQSTVSKIISMDEGALNTNQIDAIAKVLGDTPSEIFRRAERALILSDPAPTVEDQRTYDLAAKRRAARRRDVQESDYD